MLSKQGRYLINNLIKSKNFTPKSIGVLSYRNYVDTTVDTLKNLKFATSEKVFCFNLFIKLFFLEYFENVVKIKKIGS